MEFSLYFSVCYPFLVNDNSWMQPRILTRRQVYISPSTTSHQLQPPAYLISKRKANLHIHYIPYLFCCPPNQASNPRTPGCTEFSNPIPEPPRRPRVGEFEARQFRIGTAESRMMILATGNEEFRSCPNNPGNKECKRTPVGIFKPEQDRVLNQGYSLLDLHF